MARQWKAPKGKKTVAKPTSRRKDPSPNVGAGKAKPASSKAKPTSPKAKPKGRKTLPEDLEIPPDEIPPNYLFGGPTASLETLLECPARKPLPQFPQLHGRPSKLYKLVNETPHIYADLLSRIEKGSSFNVAAISVGIGERTFFEWTARGRIDLEQEEDTYFSRLVGDVLRVAAIGTGEAEQEVRKTDPRKWLAHGPGRIFGNRWAKDPNKAVASGSNASGRGGSPDQLDDDDAIDVNFQVLPHRSGSGPANPNSVPALEDKREFLQVPIAIEAQALDVLANIGQIVLSPSFKEAMERQIHGEQEQEASEALQGEVEDDEEADNP